MSARWMYRAACANLAEVTCIAMNTILTPKTGKHYTFQLSVYCKQHLRTNPESEQLRTLAMYWQIFARVMSRPLYS